MPLISGRSVEFGTPWFDLVAKKIDIDESPYYSLRMPDYVSVLALTAENRAVLVRQFRPAVERYTLELPSGNLEPDETPGQCARRELAEETGFHAEQLELLGTLLTDTGRHENRLWCYLAQSVAPLYPASQPEPGIEVVLVHWNELFDMVCKGEYDHAPHLAVLLLAIAKRGQRFTDIRALQRG